MEVYCSLLAAMPSRDDAIIDDGSVGAQILSEFHDPPVPLPSSSFSSKHRLFLLSSGQAESLPSTRTDIHLSIGKQISPSFNEYKTVMLRPNLPSSLSLSLIAATDSNSFIPSHT